MSGTRNAMEATSHLPEEVKLKVLTAGGGSSSSGFCRDVSGRWVATQWAPLAPLPPHLHSISVQSKGMSLQGGAEPGWGLPSGSLGSQFTDAHTAGHEAG